MSSSCCCSEGWKIYSNWLAPEEIVRTYLGEYYQSHPVMSRVVAIPLGVACGFFKPFIFPLWNVVGMIAMPIISLMRYTLGKNDGKAWLQASGLSFIGVIGCVAFLSLSFFTAPLYVSAGVFIAGLALSIIIHVHRASTDPT